MLKLLEPLWKVEESKKALGISAERLTSPSSVLFSQLLSCMLLGTYFNNEDCRMCSLSRMHLDICLIVFVIIIIVLTTVVTANNN